MKKNIDYMLRNVPLSLWKRVKATAANEGQTIKAWVLDAIVEKLGGENDG